MSQPKSTPASHVALLRGINVGTAKRVAMADLRALVAGLGYRDVRTLLNSGNVVFTAPARMKGDHATRIEHGIAEKLGIESRVTVLTAQELAEIVAADPLGRQATNPSRYMVAVLNDPKDAAKLRPFAGQNWKPEGWALGKRAAYIWVPEGMTQSPLAKALDRAMKDGVTTRNWATMTRLLALVHSEEENS